RAPLGLGEGLLRMVLRDLLEREDGHEAPARRRGVVLLQCHLMPQACSKNSIIFSPFFRTTYAFFQSGRCPSRRPRRFIFPCTRTTGGSATFVPNSCSTAFLISGFVASLWTSKQTVDWLSLRSVDFSVTSGRRITS